MVETENLRGRLSRVYTSLCMSIFVTLCVSARVGVASLEVLDSLRAAINGEARSVQTKALAHLLYTVSHCQSCRTPPAHRLPRYPRDYSCVCLFFSVCCHPDAVIVLEDRFLGHCAVIVTSDFKRVDSHFSS